MVANTRLKETDRELTINTLYGILNNVPRFMEQPIREKEKWAKAWNSKFPPELFAAMDVCTASGYEPNTYSSNVIRFTIPHEGKFYSTPIMLNWLTGEFNTRQPIHVSPELRAKLPWDAMQEVKNDGNNVCQSAILSLADMHKFLGEHETENFIEWIVATAALRIELVEAYQTVKDIFAMAKTAGQVKRMVPDLLQYLPPVMRKAYESQIRASSLPFDWAPYPKDRVDRMITAVGKGHLLAGMGKQHQLNWNIDGLDSCMWGREVKFTTERPMSESDD